MNKFMLLEDGRAIRSKGTVVELYKRYYTVNEAMNALRGKTIQVSWVEYVRSVHGRIVPVYTFDFV